MERVLTRITVGGALYITAVCVLPNILIGTMGQLPFKWTMPDGYPDRVEAWTPSLFARWNFAKNPLTDPAGPIGPASGSYGSRLASLRSVGWPAIRPAMLIAPSSLSAWTNVRPSSGMRLAIHSRTSACGVIETARRHPDRIGKVYAGRNGILEVTIPKQPKAQPRRIQISAS